MLTDAIWQALSGGGHGVVAMRLHAESRFNLFAALDQATDHRFLIIKSPAPNLRPGGQLPNGRGFDLQFLSTAGDPEGASCLRFELTDPAHADVFDVVGNDVLQHVLQTIDDVGAFSVFVSRITDWQQFLNQLPREGLSETAQQGLFAELWFMRTHLIPDIGVAKAVAAWAGPKLLAKDFHLAGLAFEVKSSAAKQHTQFSISSEMQLDPRGVQRLVLYGLLMEKMVGGGISLVDLVAGLKAEVKSDPVSAMRFADLLLQARYIAADAAQYTARFAIRSEKFFDVRGLFPRIVESDLRPGVGDVRYSILLSACEHFELSAAEAHTLIRATL